MHDPISINDELQDLKKQVRSYGKEVIRIEKVGNGNMAAFKMYYKDAGSETMKELFFWRHNTERLLAFLATGQ